jgi:hypothetical protein
VAGLVKRGGPLRDLKRGEALPGVGVLHGVNQSLAHMGSLGASRAASTGAPTRFTHVFFLSLLAARKGVGWHVWWRWFVGLLARGGLY